MEQASGFCWQKSTNTPRPRCRQSAGKPTPAAQQFLLLFAKSSAALLILLASTGIAPAQTFYVSNQAGGVTRIAGGSLAVDGGVDLGKVGPRGIAVTGDGKLLVTADQVTGDLSVIDPARLKPLGQIPIGPSAEMVRVQGHTAYVTHEPKNDTSGRAYIAMVDLDRRAVTSSIPSGHETEGLAFTQDGKAMLVANEGDDTVSVYALPGGSLERTISTVSFGNRPRGIARRPHGQGYVVSLEFADKLLVLDGKFNVVKTVPTKEGPYGVAFNPDGSKLFVAAAKAGVIEAFDATSFAPLGEARVGKRCWHFSFTADGGRLLAACGRSDAVYVVDAAKMTTDKVISGLHMPWGIVAYPPTAGTLQ